MGLDLTSALPYVEEQLLKDVIDKRDATECQVTVTSYHGNPRFPHFLVLFNPFYRDLPTGLIVAPLTMGVIAAPLNFSSCCETAFWSFFP